MRSLTRLAVELTGAQVLRVDDTGTSCTMTIDGAPTSELCDSTNPLAIVRRTTL